MDIYLKYFRGDISWDELRRVADPKSRAPLPIILRKNTNATRTLGFCRLALRLIEFAGERGFEWQAPYETVSWSANWPQTVRAHRDEVAMWTEWDRMKEHFQLSNNLKEVNDELEQW